MTTKYGLNRRHFLAGSTSLAFSFAGSSSSIAGSLKSRPAFPKFGVEDPDTLSGPLGTEEKFLTPRGINIAPSGPGVWRYVDGTAAEGGNGLTPTSAHKTLTEAREAAGAGDTVLIKTGQYYEEQFVVEQFGSEKATKENPITYAKWGKGSAVISAAETVGGWTKCETPSDALGNANYQKIFFSDVTPSEDVPLLNAILIEGTTVASLNMIGEHMSTADDMLIPQHKSLWFNGENEASSIADLTKSSETGALIIGSAKFREFPQGTLTGSTIIINAARNTAVEREIMEHDARAGTIAFMNDSGIAWEGKQMAVRNVPAAVSGAGQWAFRDNGDGSWRIWYWPNSAEEIEESVRLSKRKVCMDLDAAQHHRFFGLDFIGAGGEWPRDGRGATAVYSTQQNIYERHNIIFEQCRARGCYAAGLNLSGLIDARVYDCEVGLITYGRGFILDRCKQLVFAGNKSHMTGFTSVSQYSLLNCLIANNYFGEVRSVHGNGSSLYLVAKNVWLHGNLYDSKFAIAQTMQDSGNLYFTCNVVKLAAGMASRGFDDNSNFPAGYERQGGGARFGGVASHFPKPAQIVYVSNSFLPWKGAKPTENTTALQYANTTNCDHYVAANLVFGNMKRRNGKVAEQSGGRQYLATMAAFETRNIMIGIAGTRHHVVGNGFDNLNERDPLQIWENAADDPTPVKGSPADALAGDHSASLPLSEPWLTNLPDALDIVHKDFLRNDINWNDAPMGAVLGPSYT